MIDTAKTITLAELTRAAIAAAPARFHEILEADPARATRVLAGIMARAIVERGLVVTD